MPFLPTILEGNEASQMNSPSGAAINERNGHSSLTVWDGREEGTKVSGESSFPARESFTGGDDSHLSLPLSTAAASNKKSPSVILSWENISYRVVLPRGVTR